MRIKYSICIFVFIFIWVICFALVHSLYNLCSVLLLAVNESFYSCSLAGVQAINGTSNDIEKLAPQLMSAAVRVRQTPMDTGCTEHLSQLRRDWTARIHVLTSLVDDITDFNDFVLMTGN